MGNIYSVLKLHFLIYVDHDEYLFCIEIASLFYFHLEEYLFCAEIALFIYYNYEEHLFCSDITSTDFVLNQSASLLTSVRLANHVT